MLQDEILLKIEKPARYIGGEVNSVMKDLKDIDVRFVMCFPDVYEIGMSHLGIQILYEMFNSYEDTWCERVYSPWPDLDAVMRKEQIPLFALESQDPIAEFDFLGITLQYEMCYTNILQILDLSGIPLTNAERGADTLLADCRYPIVIGGGPCSYNPEPIADFFDLFYIGEGETQYRALLDLYKKMRDEGKTRGSFLHEAAKLEGIYCPSLYRTSYYEDGTIKSFEPLFEELPRKIKKEIVSDLTGAVYPQKQVVPFIKVTQDRVVLEVMRGCIRGCRFCQAGQLYKPLRERDAAVLKQYTDTLLQNTGHEEISLSSLSSSDYSQLETLLNELIESCREKKVNISLPSLRIDAFSLDVMSKVQDVKKSSLTFAPEAGTQRLRNVINKGLSEEDILNGSAEAFRGGWSRVKLYFMLGLPTETEQDIEGIAVLANEIAKTFYETVPKSERKGRVQIVVSTSFFVPKPFTPFQWAPMNRKEDFIEKARKTKDAIRSQLNQKSITYNWHESDVSVMEGIFARGDRRLCDVILTAYKKGCLFDAWTDFYKDELWMESFAQCGVEPDFYYARERMEDEILPWDFIDCGVNRSFLWKEWERAQRGVVTTNCRESCAGCGAAKYGAEICFSSKNG